ncbi:hypothetical protein S245_039403, partial [Arachis hypogaea]
MLRRKMVKSAKESLKQKASKSEIYGNLQANHSVAKELAELKEIVLNGEDKGENKESTFDLEKHIDAYLL